MMFIFAQNQTKIVNTKAGAAIFVDKNTVRLSTTVLQNAEVSFTPGNGNVDLYVGIIILAEYQTEYRANEVLRQIFQAIQKGQPTFEMPEE